jgi:hypothetical protein
MKTGLCRLKKFKSRGSFKAPGLPPLAGIFLVLLSLASCVSPPSFEELYPDGGFSALEAGGLLYFAAEVSSARPILNYLSLAGYSLAEMAQMLDRTDRAVAAFYPEGGGRRFMALGEGNYPARSIAFSFTFDPAWGQQKSARGHRYWRSKSLSLSLSTTRALISDADPFIDPPGVEIPADFPALLPNAAMAGWTTEGAGGINRILAAQGLPVQIPSNLILFAAYPESAPPSDAESGTAAGPAKERYQVLLKIHTPSAMQARGLAALFSFASSFLPQTANSGEGGWSLILALLAKPPEVSGAALIFKTPPLGAETIAVLFNSMAVY